MNQSLMGLVRQALMILLSFEQWQAPLLFMLISGSEIPVATLSLLGIADGRGVLLRDWNWNGLYRR
jgi:hypothetical protein